MEYSICEEFEHALIAKSEKAFFISECDLQSNSATLQVVHQVQSFCKRMMNVRGIPVVKGG